MSDGPVAVSFCDETLEAIHVESTWRVGTAETESTGAQTADLVTQDQATMVTETHDVACQTRGLGDQNLQNEQYTEDFVQAVKSMGNVMLNELCKSRSKAFENYQVQLDEEEGSMSCLLTMNEADSERFTDMPCTGLAWNSTGSVLAASFGHTDHFDWCHHKSRICMWNIDRHDKQAKKPDNYIDVDSCVTCIQFHPTIPGVIAAGTFTGDVIMWDLARDQESSVLLSDSQQENHGDTVNHVHWLVEKRKSSVLSITVSGKVSVWVIAQKGAGLKVQKSHVIDAPHNFKLRLKADSIGTSNVTFDPEDNGTFLLGTETGGVFKCSRDSDHVTADLAFKPHQGPVYGLQYSNLNRNIFLSCGTDGCLSVYSSLQEAPLVSLEPCQGYLYSCRWSPVAPSVIGVGGSRGKIILYNLDYSHLAPYQVIDCCEKRTPVHCLEFNKKHTDLLASADARGLVKVWTLGGELTSGNSQEMPAVLRDMMTGEAEG